MRLTTDSPIRFVQTVLFYAALGAMWNLGNVGWKKISGDTGEKLIIRKTARAVGLGAGAGALVAIWGDEANPGNFEVAMGVVVPLFDKVWNAYENGMETYNNADDGDGEKMDEAALALVSAVETLQSSDPHDPTERPDNADKPDASTQSGPDSANEYAQPTETPQSRENERDTTSPTDDERVKSGP